MFNAPVHQRILHMILIDFLLCYHFLLNVVMIVYNPTHGAVHTSAGVRKTGRLHWELLAHQEYGMD